MVLEKVIIVVLLVFLNYGCIRNIPTIEEYTKHWIGRSIEDKRKIASRPETYGSRIGWQETTYKLPNEYWVYIEPDKKDCFIHWEVNPHGIIVGYKLQGDSCY